MAYNFGIFVDGHCMYIISVRWFYLQYFSEGPTYLSTRTKHRSPMRSLFGGFTVIILEIRIMEDSDNRSSDKCTIDFFLCVCVC